MNESSKFQTKISHSDCKNGHVDIQQKVINDIVPKLVCIHCQGSIFTESPFVLSTEEVRYLHDSIQHEYLNKDTYYFASRLFSRMQEFLEEKK